MTEKHLFLAQIGPVQSFIAQARRTKDLYVGSQMLSQLAVAAVEAASRTAGFAPIFPYVEGNKVHHGVSSHVLAFLTEQTPQAMAETLRDALRTQWMEFAQPVRDWLIDQVGGGAWETVFDRQAEPFPTDTAPGWMEFYWVALAYEPEKHGDVYSRARIALSQRKLFRQITPVNEPNKKCTLTGAQEALPFTTPQIAAIRKGIEDHNAIILRENEQLGTLALIKRLWAEITHKERASRFLSLDTIAADDPEVREGARGEKRELTGYITILHMDGDKMGETLSRLRTLKEHQEFSRRLANFAHTDVPQIIKDNGGRTGQLVYAGGDDVLALLPLRCALGCAEELRQAFERVVGGGMTASAGIAITPIKLPLDFALEMARDAEKDAKETHGRNAIAIAEAHGSTGLRTTGAKWDKLPHVLALQAAFGKTKGVRVLSGKFPFDLQHIADVMVGGAVTPAMREAEMRRVLNRRLDDSLSPEEKKAKTDQLAPHVLALAEPHDTPKPQWGEAANWAILARFLASGGVRADEEQT